MRMPLLRMSGCGEKEECDEKKGSFQPSLLLWGPETTVIPQRSGLADGVRGRNLASPSGFAQKVAKNRPWSGSILLCGLCVSL